MGSDCKERTGSPNVQGNEDAIWNGENHRDFNPNAWETLVVLPGVEVIPSNTFYHFNNIMKVIMADTQ